MCYGVPDATSQMPPPALLRPPPFQLLVQDQGDSEVPSDEKSPSRDFSGEEGGVCVQKARQGP